LVGVEDGDHPAFLGVEVGVGRVSGKGLNFGLKLFGGWAAAARCC
jgi:hypothetical protein